MNTDHALHEPPDASFEAPGREIVEITPPAHVSQAVVRTVHSELAINEALPGLKLHEPTALLLDINNLYRRSRDNNFRIDYLRLINILRARCDLRYAAAFSAVDRDDPEALDWLKYMNDVGYDIINRDLINYTGDDGRQVMKGNMDIEIAISAMKLSHGFTHVIIGTCDGDFVPLVHELQEDPIRRVSVLGISGENWKGMSKSLARAADNFYDLSKLVDEIHYRGGRNG
jgi:uncharacterized LabA/DUF88 family protein